MSNLNTRYPGTQSFESSQRDLFFGRDKDIEKLTKMIELEQMVLVYAKSGIGKTSLINAGILPQLGEKGSYTFHKIRFGTWKEGNPTPHELAAKSFTNLKADQNYLDKIIYQDHSLWYFAKKWQMQQSRDDSTLLLVLDQFEELFTYPAKAVTQFKKDLADLLFTVVPQRFSDQKELLEDLKPGFITKADEKLLYEQPNVKILFAIRSDKMSELNNMSDYIPRILLKHYELAPLTNEQALDAIEKPALKNGDFASQKFTYHHAALDEIMQFLTKDGKQEDNVESFQLQILCKVVESKVVAYNLKEVLPDHVSPVRDIYQNYYDNLIDSLALSEEQTLAVRIMIEEGLIEQATQRRLQLSAEQIALQYKVDKEVLSLLINERLFRTEERDNYRLFELAHDTLVEPILASREIRIEREEKEKADLERAEELRKAREKTEKERLEKDKQKKQNKKLRLFLAFSIISFLIASFFSYFAYKQYKWAEIQNERANFARELANENASKAQKQEKITKDLLKYLIKDSEVEDSSYYAFFYKRGIENYKALKYKEALQNFQIAEICPDVDSIKGEIVKDWQEKTIEAINLKTNGDNEFSAGIYERAIFYYTMIVEIDTIESEIVKLINLAKSLSKLQIKGADFLQAKEYENAYKIFKSLLIKNPSDERTARGIEICERNLKVTSSPLPTTTKQSQIGYSTKKRLALVFGNGTYPTSPLNNPVNDANAVAKILKELNFDVIKVLNCNLNDMKLKIREFGNKLSNYDVGLFYFAGHSIMVNGDDYFIPVDADIQKENDIELESVNLRRVLGELEYSKVKISIILLDGSRDNPFARSARSFSKNKDIFGYNFNYYPDESLGTFIMYATSPGYVASDGAGDHGLFTEALLKYLKSPNMTIEQIMKMVRKYVIDKSGGRQIPYSSNTLLIDFYFNKTSK